MEMCVSPDTRYPGPWSAISLEPSRAQHGSPKEGTQVHSENQHPTEVRMHAVPRRGPGNVTGWGDTLLAWVATDSPCFFSDMVILRTKSPWVCNNSDTGLLLPLGTRGPPACQFDSMLVFYPDGLYHTGL